MFCAHAVAAAAAEKAGKLDKYLEWLKRRSKPLNLTKLVMFDSNKGVGRKGNKSSTSKRKGTRRNKNEPEPTVFVDHVSQDTTRQLEERQQQEQQKQ